MSGTNALRCSKRGDEARIASHLLFELAFPAGSWLPGELVVIAGGALALPFLLDRALRNPTA